MQHHSKIFIHACNIIAAFSLLLSFNCTRSSSNASDEYALNKLPTLCMPITSTQQADYRYFDVFKNGGKVYVLGNNSSNATLDLFSITDQSYVKSIPYNNTGPDAIRDVLGIKVIDSRLVWIISTDHFFSYNLEIGKVENSFSFSELDTRLVWNKYTYFFDNHGHVVALNDSILLLRAANPPLYGGNSRLHLVSLNVKTRTIKELPIKLPEWLNENNHFAGLNTFHFSYSEKKIYYNYPFSDSLFKYDLVSNQLLVPTQLNSPLLPSLVTQYKGKSNMADIIEYSSNSDYHMSFQHLDSNPSILYRFAIKTDQKPDTEYSTFIEVFNEDELIATEQIGSNYKTRTFSIEDKIYLFKEGEDENHLCFGVLAVSGAKEN